VIFVIITKVLQQCFTPRMGQLFHPQSGALRPCGLESVSANGVGEAPATSYQGDVNIMGKTLMTKKCALWTIHQLPPL